MVTALSFSSFFFLFFSLLFLVYLALLDLLLDEDLLSDLEEEEEGTLWAFKKEEGG